MAASAAAIPIAFQVAGGALAVITAIKGLKNGNLLQAVLGGVGAYFAFSGLGAMTAAQAATAQGAPGVVNSAAAAAGKSADLSALTAAGGMNAETAAQAAFTSGLTADAAGGTNLLTQGVSSGSGAAGNLAKGLSFGGNELANSATQFKSGLAGKGLLPSLASSPTAPTQALSINGVSQAAQQPSNFLSGISSWGKDNPELAAGLLQTGGNMLSGYAQGAAREEELKRILEEEAQRRARIGASAPAESFRLKFN